MVFDLLKFKLKNGLRGVIACLNGLGLGFLLRRMGMARGAGVVMTHCIGHEEETAYLPPDMKTSVDKLDRLLRCLKRRGIRCVSVREVVEALDRGEEARDLVAFTMDDGYLDNLTRALPVLEKYEASATVFVETNVVSRREVSWLHRYFYICHHKGEDFFVRAYTEKTNEKEVREKMASAPDGQSALYMLKRILKYDADRSDRDRVTREILQSTGATDEDIARAYLKWEDVVELDRRGVEIGAHTLHHEILSRLDNDEAAEEIEGSVRDITEHIENPVASFAYPFGRPWDYREEFFPIIQRAGCTSACAAIDGTNDPGTDRMQLRRLPLNDDIPLSYVLAEIDGSFALVRKLLRINL